MPLSAFSLERVHTICGWTLVRTINNMTPRRGYTVAAVACLAASVATVSAFSLNGKNHEMKKHVFVRSLRSSRVSLVVVLVCVMVS